MATRDVMRRTALRPVGLWLLLPCFAASGASGLAYEILWVRLIQNSVGSSAPAIAIAVSVFFLGLSIGAAVGPRFFDGRDDLRRYGFLELLIGLCALLVPSAFRVMDMAIALIPAGVDRTGPTLTLSASILLVPCCLLGVTLPAMVGIVRDATNRGSAIGLLYGCNTLGAVVGTILAGLFLLPSLGVAASGRLLAGANLVVGSIVIALDALARRRSIETPYGRSVPAVDKQAERTPFLENPARRNAAIVDFIPANQALLIAFSSGFLGIAAEVLCVRAFQFYFSQTVYVLCLILTAYLLGTALGGVALSAYLRRREPKRSVLSLMYTFAGIGFLLLIILLPDTPALRAEFVAAGYIRNFTTHLIGFWIIAGALLILPTLAMGVALPLLMGVVHSADDQVLWPSRVYSLNTIGGVAGSLVGTFLLMPRLGVTAAMEAVVVAWFVLAVTVSSGARARNARVLAGVALAGMLLAIATQAIPSVDRHDSELRSSREMGRAAPFEILFSEDAASGSVKVIEAANGVRTLKVDESYSLGNTAAGSVSLNYAMAHLASLNAPKHPKRALLVGYATGATLAALATHAFSHVDCIELQSAVVRTDDFFHQINWNVRDDPRVTVYTGDGRAFLQHRGPAYDLIMGDIYVPSRASALYSREYFDAVQRRLTDEGVFVSWVPLWQIGPDGLASVVRANINAFGNVRGYVLSGPRFDGRLLALVSTSRPPTGERAPDVSVEALAERVSESMLRSFRSWPKELAERLQIETTLDTQALETLAARAPENTLDTPILEFSAPRNRVNAQLKKIDLSETNTVALERLRRPSD